MTEPFIIDLYHIHKFNYFQHLVAKYSEGFPLDNNEIRLCQEFFEELCEEPIFLVEVFNMPEAYNLFLDLINDGYLKLD